MACLGGILALLGLPLLLGYFISGRKSVMWGNLGGIMLVVGIVIAVIGMATQQ